MVQASALTEATEQGVETPEVSEDTSERETDAQFRERMAQPYNDALIRLRGLQSRLPNNDPGPDPLPEEPTYQTGFGEHTFTEIHDKTRRLAAHILRYQYGVEDHDDIEDCLQLGYLKLWQKLENEPEWALDKGDRYLARFVTMRTKSMRRSNITYDSRNEILPEDIHPPGFAPQSRESRQTDRRIDLQWAIDAVSELCGDNPLRMQALYYVLTSVGIKDMQEMGMSRHTLRDHTKTVRDLFRSELHGSPSRASFSR